MTTEELNCWESVLYSAREELSQEKDWSSLERETDRQTDRQTDNSQETSRKTEVRSGVCNLCSEATETFGVLSLFRVMHCYSYSKIKSIIINCNSAWQIYNKSSVKSRTH
jgi:hypothetical protein